MTSLRAARGRLYMAMHTVFVIQAIREGKTQRHWSENTMKNVASYLTGCCADYSLLERGQKSTRKILPFLLESTVAVYLAYDLHSAGLGDNTVISHPDWGLFGLESTAVMGGVLPESESRGV